MMRHPVPTSCLSLLMLAGGTLASPAQERPRFPERRGAEAWQPVLPPCQCRAAGQLWSIGQEVCLEHGGRRMAYICGMQQNVTSWVETGRGCPEG